MPPPSPLERARGARRRPVLVAALLGAAAAACGDDAGRAVPPGAASPATDAAEPPRATAPPPAPSGRLSFRDRAGEARVLVENWCGSDRDEKRSILESIGQGAAWLDDDGDGLLDLFVVNGSSNEAIPDPPPTDRYFRNAGDGTFEDVTRELGLADERWGNGVAAADVEGDGDTDLFVTHWGPHALWVRGEDGRFTDRAAAAGVACEEIGPRPWGSAACFGDSDLDGDLDLFVGHYLEFDPADPPGGGRMRVWKGIREAYFGPLGCVPQPDRLFANRGDGTFEDVSVPSGIDAALSAYTLGALFADLDQDGDPDLYVANDSMANYAFVNDGGGRFEERGELLGLAYGHTGNAQAGMGVDCADFDGDGWDDVLVTNFDDDVNTLYRYAGRSFRDVTVQVGLAACTRNHLSWGCGLHDLDLDGDLDAVMVSGHVYPRAEIDDPVTGYRQNDLLLEQVGGRFVDASPTAGPAFALREVGRGAAFGDYDADGDVDFLVVDLNRFPILYHNESERAGAWLQVLLRGRAPNTGGVGSRVTVVAGGVERSRERRAGASYLSTNSPWLHFGLGPVERVDEVRVRWPSGATTRHGPFDANARAVIREP